MSVKLIRYWFEFEYEHYSELPMGLALGCGITALTYEDAIALLKEKIFLDKPITAFKKLIENVDVSTLEANHVLPNLGAPTTARGIWYPAGYTDYFNWPNG